MNHNYISFFTATILEWKDILYNDTYKQIITDSMRFLVENNRATIYAFVIMPTHIHLVWKVNNDRNPDDIQRDFLKFTAQQIKFNMIDNNSERINEFLVNAKDRTYQIWERNPLTSRLPVIELVEQKINYIHRNPVSGKWNLCNNLTEYKYSSARFYYEGVDDWGFLTHYTAAIDI